MEVMSPADRAEEIWLMTRWSDEPSYRDWRRSAEYHQSHLGIPKGLKVVPDSASITLFDVFAS